jgi:hypothetical protein
MKEGTRVKKRGKGGKREKEEKGGRRTEKGLNGGRKREKGLNGGNGGKVEKWEQKGIRGRTKKEQETKRE